jgi:transposase
MGYPGTRRMVDTWVQQRRDAPAPTTPRKYLKTAADITTVRLAAPQTALAPITPSSRRLAFSLLRAPTSLSVTEQAVLAQLKQRCPKLAKAYPLVHGFGRMLRQRLPDMFDTWLQCVAQSDVPELQAFAAGLRRDEAAVRSALSLPWSNGQTEGQITRLKQLKRQMYGRANFDLL